MLEVQQAAMGSEARSRLDSMRADLGLPAGGTGQLTTGTSGQELTTGTGTAIPVTTESPAAVTANDAEETPQDRS